jgi:serine/threonine-protein kinase
MIHHPAMDGVEAYNELSDRMLGKYRLIASLGEGGMASVYLAIVEGRAGFQKLVVVKVMRESLGRDTDALTMFEQEARIASRLNHPNIVQTNEVGEDGGAHYLTMEYLEGQPLHQILMENGRGEPLALSLHARILADALAGLHYAHESADFDGKPLNLVHRDVSPHNVFVTYDGTIKIIDFGIAKSSLDDSKTATGILKGKLGYMAPEQLMGIPLDRRADVYAVGVMLWEAAAGQRLRKAKAEAPLLHSILNDDVPSPRTVNPACPAAMASICLKALARDRDQRHATAQELQYEIEAFLESTEIASGGIRHLNRSIGSFVSTKFAQERERIRLLVERRLAGATGTMPAPTSGIDVIVEKTSNEGAGEGKRLAPDASGSAPAATNTGGTLASQVRSPRARQLRLAAIVGASVLVAGGLAAMAMRSKAPPNLTAAAPVPSASASAASATTEAAAPETAATNASVQDASGAVRISISAVPPTAQILVDGKPVSGNPAVLDTTRDDVTHHSIRVEAAGFASQTRSVAFDRNLDLVFTMIKAGAPAAAAHRGGARAAAAPPPPAVAENTPAPAPPPPAPPPAPAPASSHRQLDETNPWQK